MIINRNNLKQLNELFTSKSSLHFSINTQYKILKLKKQLSSELEIYNQQLSSLQDYFERDEDGNFIQYQGGVKVKQEFLEECQSKIFEINETEISLPDLYFSLEELEPLNLTLGEHELLDPFIKI